jgi:hypothetical protein
MSINIGGKLEYYSNRLREAKEDGDDEEIQKYQKKVSELEEQLDRT